ncbi:hypothetical protein AB0G73_33220 [Streptomyces sp. NPDC020719]|uniref:hypothetical protein n=1 Tax=Streptomyces sp. NPDC020719 TaxID=3154896 RepID=UPI0033F3A8DB
MAAQWGFASATAFGRAFRNAYGITPGENRAATRASCAAPRAERPHPPVNFTASAPSFIERAARAGREAASHANSTCARAGASALSGSGRFTDCQPTRTPGPRLPVRRCTGRPRPGSP